MHQSIPQVRLHQSSIYLQQHKYLSEMRRYFIRLYFPQFETSIGRYMVIIEKMWTSVVLGKKWVNQQVQLTIFDNFIFKNSRLWLKHSLSTVSFCGIPLSLWIYCEANEPTEKIISLEVKLANGPSDSSDIMWKRKVYSWI